MFDDEEVVLADSELHKYMKSNYDANNLEDVCEIVNSDSIHTNVVCDFTRKESDSVAFSESQKVAFQNCAENCSNIIYIILKTGLLYPDHIMDLESYINISNVKEQRNICSNIIYSTGLISSTSLLLLKNFKLLQFVGFAAATFCSCKLYAIVKLYNETNQIKCFSTAAENLFSINKQVLSFILESEFILRSKIMRDQQVYLPSNGWVHLNTTEGLKNSGLLVPQLRKVLMAVYIDVISKFNNFLKYLRTRLFINFAIDDKLEIPAEFYTFQRQAEFIPSSEDLKKLSTVYLLIQSECLKCIILLFLDGNKTSLNTEITTCIDCFVTCSKKLKILYLKCISEVENNSLSIKTNSLLQAESTNSKLYIFIKSFLTKANAHVLSLFLDLNMVNDWVNEFEENNKDNNSDVNKKLVIMLHERLLQLKTNLESFNNLYNDNCTLLRRIADKNSKVPCDNLDVEEKSNESVTVTGIKVGKSDFKYSGKDEVLISLENRDDNNWTQGTTVDYEEHMVNQVLPKSVLNELKCALQGKKEEWIEREKKAICNQNVSIDSLDFDNLLSSSYNDCASKQLDAVLNTSSTNHVEIDKGIDLVSHSNDHVVQETASECDDSLYYSFNTNYSNNVSQNNSKSSDDTLIFNCESPIMPGGNFSDQIKIAQRSFNLNTSEELLGDSSGDEEN